jgi:hypothetical protein
VCSPSEDPGTDTVETEAAPDAAAPAPAAAAATTAAPKPAAPKPAAAPPKPKAPTCVGATDDDTAVAAGQPIELSGWTTTATPLARTAGPFGGEILCSSITLADNDDEQQEYCSLSWKLQSPNGSVIDSNYQGENNLESAGPAADGTVTKDVCFDDEGAGAGRYDLSWQPDVLSSNKRGVWLNTLQGSQSAWR